MLQKGVVYTFMSDSTPDFIHYDEKTKEPCLRNIARTPYFPEAEFLPTLAKGRNMKYRASITVSAEPARHRVVAAEYVTSRGYDLEAMYRTIGMEGNRRCGS